MSRDASSSRCCSAWRRRRPTPCGPTTGGLLLYTPVVHPEEFDAAISYLVRRLEENASTDNFLSGLFDLDDAAIYQRERDRFAASMQDLDLDLPAPRRTQDRLHPSLPHAGRDFENEADTDPALAVNREWGRGILARSATSKLGVDTNAASVVPDETLCARSSSVRPKLARSGARCRAPTAASCSTGSARCSACSAGG